MSEQSHLENRQLLMAEELKQKQQEYLDQLREWRYSRFVETDRMWIRAMQISRTTGDLKEVLAVEAEAQRLRDLPQVIIKELISAAEVKDIAALDLPKVPEDEPLPKKVDELAAAAAVADVPLTP